jgi:hypothetical protein
MTVHFGSQKFQGSYAFQHCIGLKLFFHKAFEIFLIGLVLFSDLMNFRFFTICCEYLKEKIKYLCYIFFMCAIKPKQL